MRFFSRRRLPSTFTNCERGATAIEYALIATLICVAIISALTLFADNTGSMFDSISNAVGNSTQ